MIHVIHVAGQGGHEQNICDREKAQTKDDVNPCFDEADDYFEHNIFLSMKKISRNGTPAGNTHGGVAMVAVPDSITWGAMVISAPPTGKK